MICEMSHTTLSGEYRLIVRNRNSIRHDTGWFKNLILNSGLNRIGTQNSGDSPRIIAYCKLGTGTSPPNVNQTALDNQIAQASYISSSGSGNQGGPTYAGRLQYLYKFDYGDVVGTISEVGIGWEFGLGNLFSRTLIQPAPITVTADEFLEVYYRLDFIPILTDTSGTVNISGTNYNFTIRRTGVNTYTPSENTNRLSGRESILAAYNGFSLVPITSEVTAVPLGYSSQYSTASYVNNSYYLDTTLTIFGGTMNNINGFVYWMGIRALGNTQYNLGAYQILLNTPITKLFYQSISLTIRNSWARA